MADLAIPRRVSDDVTIDTPTANSPVTLVNGGTFTVNGELKNDCNKAYVKVYPIDVADEDIPDHPPSDALECEVTNPGTVQHEHTMVPAVASKLTPNGNDNKVVVWPVRIGAKVALEFKGQSNANNPGITVNANNSMWFAFAPREFGTGFAESGDPTPGQVSQYRPVPLVVPSDATIASVTATGEWEHHPGNTSDADGRSGTDRDVEHPKIYKTDYLNTSGFSSTSVPLNALVGLKANDKDDAEEFLIGTSFLNQDLAGFTRLFLAFHDGFEWANNSGDLTVSVNWSS